jgi:hypothetical protein
MKVFSGANFDIYVYSNEAFQPHHLPHCHVRYRYGGEVLIVLPTLSVIHGKKLKKNDSSLIMENLDAICDAWNRLNPEIKIK